MVRCNLMYALCNRWIDTHTQNKKKKKKRYSLLNCPLILKQCTAHVMEVNAGIHLKVLPVLCKQFKAVQTKVTLWQFMICKVQLTVCKHKKAVRNEKRAKNKQNRQSIRDSMTSFSYQGYFSLGVTLCYCQLQSNSF